MLGDIVLKTQALLAWKAYPIRANACVRACRWIRNPDLANCAAYPPNPMKDFDNIWMHPNMMDPILYSLPAKSILSNMHWRWHPDVKPALIDQQMRSAYAFGSFDLEKLSSHSHMIPSYLLLHPRITLSVFWNQLNICHMRPVTMSNDESLDYLTILPIELGIAHVGATVVRHFDLYYCDFSRVLDS